MSQVTCETSFNPALSVILDGLYYTDDREVTVGELERGFSLREAEIVFSGSVDPYVDVWILAVGDGEIAIEEGYVQTRRCLPGLQMRAGKFFSGFGYVNRQHPHQWDFVDRPLSYEALLDGSVNETGLQLTWLPNLPFYAQQTRAGEAETTEVLQGHGEVLGSTWCGSTTRARPTGGEFSQLRAQFDHGNLHVLATRQTYNQFFVQFQMSLGAHGAHRF